MKIKLLQMWLFSLIGILFFTACIRDEAQNAEADILTLRVADNILLRQPIIANDKVTLYVHAWEDVTEIAPEFTLTEGATISPASGTVRDFTEPQVYTVTSQDKRWSKNYTVSFVKEGVVTEYHFEEMRPYTYSGQEKFHILYEKRTDGSEMEWGSGNAGWMITNSSAPMTDYPTVQVDSGVVGKCIQLTTRSTGFFGSLAGAPIAAGNLFFGTFQINLANPAKSTRFGIPFNKVPQRLTGYYKYTVGTGDYYKDAKKQSTPSEDMFDIYAVFYEVTDDVPYLDGTNILTSENIISIARLQEKKETKEWTEFAIPFVLQDGKSVDAEKLANQRYNLAIVLTSSIDGAVFTGRIGSMLHVDEMILYCEE